MTARRAAVLAAIVFGMFLLKRHYSTAAVEDLRWILWPTTTLVSAVSGAAFEFVPGEGYLSRERLFLVEKSCAGVNFLIAAFGMSGFALSQGVNGGRRAAAAVAGALVAGYAAAVFVNATRILVAMWLVSADLASGWWTAERLHRLEGIAVYFTGLMLLDRAARAVTPAWPLRETR